MIPLSLALKISKRWRSDDRLPLSGTVVEFKKDDPEAARAWASDGHRLIVMDVPRTEGTEGVWYDTKTRRQISELDSGTKPPPIDALLEKNQPSNETAVRLSVGWVRDVLGSLVRMHNPRRCAMWITFAGEACRVHMSEIWTDKQEREARKSRKVKVPVSFELEIKTTNVKSGDGPHQNNKVFSVNPRYLLEAVEDLGWYDDDAIVTLTQAADRLDPICIDGPRGFALIMPIRP